MTKAKAKVKVAEQEDTPVKGDLIFITPAGHEWITRSQKFPGLNLSGRTAMVMSVYDWDTEHGKDILKKREETGKWVGLPSRDFKYIVTVFYPDLEHEGKQGLMHPEMLCLNHPRMEGESPLFRKYPKHLLGYISGEKVLSIL